MKRINMLAIIVGIMFIFLGVNSFAADEAALKVTAKNGKVFVKIYPSTEWTELTVGQMVHARDVIKTDLCGARYDEKEKQYVDANGNVCPICGAATLELPDRSSISIKPDSEVSIDELVLDNAARKLKLNMAKGELRMIITKVATPSDFSVKTPNAIYGATGTLFYTKSTSTGGSVYVADGSINAISPIDGKIYNVVAGMMMTFNADGTVIGPVPVSDLDVSNWTACYTPTVEPYTPVPGPLDVDPPHHTPERPVSGG